MCATRSKVCLLGSVWLLLASLPSWSYTYDGPQLPPGWLPISTAELTALETILSEQETTLERQAETLTTLSTTIARLETTTERLERSFAEYESAASQETTRLRRELWLWRGATVISAVLAVTFFLR